MSEKNKKVDLEINEHNRGYYLIAIIIIAIGMVASFMAASPEQRDELLNLGGAGAMFESFPEQVKIFGTN